ncbi:MAG: NADH-quinone oxidoreductase subunit M [Nitrososphaerales archaeon]
MIEYLLILALLLPLICSPLPYLLGGKKGGLLSFLILLISTLSIGYLLIQYYLNPNREPFIVWYNWAPDLGLTFGLNGDGLGLFMSFTIAILALALSLYSIEYMEHEEDVGSYFTLYLLYSSGMIGCVLASDLIEFYLFFELMLIPSWALINQWGTGLREKVAFKYFIYTHVGALSLLIGILATGMLYGTFDLFRIQILLSKQFKPDIIISQIAAILMLIGLMVKLAIFPFHTWLPDAHAEAPTPISALLSPAMIGIGGYGILRFVYGSYPHIITNFSSILIFQSLFTMIYGGLMALKQNDLKRLLAYSSISQMGYILFGIAANSPLAIVGSMLHYFSHATCKAMLFMVSGIFMHQINVRDIDKLGSLASKMPYTAIAMIIGFLGIAGTPPFNGFQSEWMIFSGALIYGSLDKQSIIVGLALLSTALTASYGLWTVKRVLFGSKYLNLDIKEADMLMIAPLILLILLTTVIGIYPQPLITPINSTIS